MKSIGYMLKTIRLQNNETQEQLATILGVHRITVVKWEAGKMDMSATMIVKICYHYHISADVILCIPFEYR